ncbi:MAG: DNA polymerase III subunit beta [Cyanobacteriota bacterium]|nr:DNA polymerase III subunit beta [Cyanobacteriota bacterium]
MKLVCDQSELNANLSLAIHAVPSRPTHPVLGNVLLTADAETHQVRIAAFDLSLGIRTSFPAQVEDGGEITLPAKLLNDIVSKLPNGEITLDRQGEDSIATLTSRLGQYYQVRGMSADEFPELPEIDTGKVVQLSAAALAEGLKGTLFATSGDETKQVLTGVHLRVSGEGLEFAATDGHRLAVVETLHPEEEAEAEESEEAAETATEKPSLAPTEEFEVTIPAIALRELERMLGKQTAKDIVSLKCDDVQVVFELGERQCLTSRKLEGAYPAYRQLIPRQFDNQMNVDRRQLLAALERIAVMAGKNNIVKFSLDTEKQQLSLSVEAADVGSGKEAMDAQITGESIEIAFNVRYVTESLRNLQASEVQIQLNTPTSPVILTPLGGVKMTHLVMPVQIRN